MFNLRILFTLFNLNEIYKYFLLILNQLFEILFELDDGDDDLDF